MPDVNRPAGDDVLAKQHRKHPSPFGYLIDGVQRLVGDGQVDQVQELARRRRLLVDSRRRALHSRHRQGHDERLTHVERMRDDRQPRRRRRATLAASVGLVHGRARNELVFLEVHCPTIVIPPPRARTRTHTNTHRDPHNLAGVFLREPVAACLRPGPTEFL
ncbi:hypothetical protein HPB50_022741 [Hyalomma asiaticum]|uniref:Uncharacterized protein n=1 Tax=Hyalomma asiaticum TaxID=266040 RepID=A0ACB7TP95_HYAAI|nr:hypothetical protein HPB50_022741 [Hyalomma asiaticum]